jgi:Zn-finger nucleic acid-binding protein
VIWAIYNSSMSADSDTLCPDCKVEMDQIDKTTFTGRDMREYQCPKCGRKQILDRGKALWEILSEANRQSDEEE